MARLMYQHERAGSDLVLVKAPKDIPIFITVDGSFLHRAVDINLGERELAAWAGPSGPGGRTLTVEVGKPSAVSFMKDFFGFRTGASVSGGGVIATGRGAIAAGGDVIGNALGKGAVVSMGGSAKESGVNSLLFGIHLELPFHCEFEAKNDNPVTVTIGEQQVDLTEAYRRSYVEIP